MNINHEKSLELIEDLMNVFETMFHEILYIRKIYPDYVFEKQFKERKKNLIIFSIALMMSGGTHCLFYNNDF